MRTGKRATIGRVLPGTAAEVTPVGSIADYKFTPGDITRALVEGYDALVRAAPASAEAAE